MINNESGNRVNKLKYIIAERAAEQARGLRRLAASFRFRSKRRRLARHVRKATDDLAEEATELREQLLERALAVLRIDLEHSAATAQRNARQQITRVFSTPYLVFPRSN